LFIYSVRMNVHTLKITPQYSLIDYHLQSQCCFYILSVPMSCLIDRYARYGEVSRKVDVYAFGIAQYELLSAKEAIVIDQQNSLMHKAWFIW
jgi:hypothetical protein